jgi:hypothetical protein
VGDGTSPLLLDRHGIGQRGGNHLLLAKDLKLINPNDDAELSQRATESKRMLTALVQKLKGDR